MQKIFAAQKKAHVEHGPLTAAERAEWLNRLIGLLVDHKQEIADTISADFGNRSQTLSLLADVLASVGSLKFARDHLGEWMASQTFPPASLGAEAEVIYQPLGVVGLVSPWNFPFNLTFAPLAGIIAAGNRCMIKPSEVSPKTSDLMARLIRSAFDETEIAVVLGGPEVAAEFTGLAFDHLIYTGSTAVGRIVMKAAAANLTPVTLELGGKSPVIVSRTAALDDAAARVLTIKTLNAGQICLAPDYVLLPEEQVEAFVTSATAAVAKMYPRIADNPDYTAIINDKHYARLQGYLADARASGARIVEINPARESFEGLPVRRLPPTLVIGPKADSAIMKDEIFGPLLPVLTYRTIDEAIAFVNARPRPLALYYFGRDAAEEQRVLSRTSSGGVTVNDVMTHAFSETMPFGGVGASGMGAYHGEAGFRTFSHARAVYHQGKSVEAEHALRAPFGAPMKSYLDTAIAR